MLAESGYITIIDSYFYFFCNIVSIYSLNSAASLYLGGLESMPGYQLMLEVLFS